MTFKQVGLKSDKPGFPLSPSIDIKYAWKCQYFCRLFSLIKLGEAHFERFQLNKKMAYS